MIRFLFSGRVWRGAPMILALLAASVFGLALLMQHLHENDPGFRAWFEPETPEPPPYYADYAYEPLGGRPIRVSLNGVAFNLPRGTGMRISLVLDGEVRQVDFMPHGFERNPYQQQMLAMLEERHDAVPIIGFGLFNFGSDTGSPCRPDNGDWNIRFCRKVEALINEAASGNFVWQGSLSFRQNRFRHSPSSTGFPGILFGNEAFRRSAEINFSFSNFENGCMTGTSSPPRHQGFGGHYCKILLFHEAGFMTETNYYFRQDQESKIDSYLLSIIRLADSIID